jgi:hypothetical protein
VLVGNGGVLAPGNAAIGTLTVSNDLTFSSGGVCCMKVNKAAATNDLVQGVRQLNLGGTLVVSNLSGTLAAADSFRLFSAGNCAGDFGAILPAAPGAGLAWSTAQLRARGILGVIAVNTNTANLSANLTNGNVNLTWPADHTGWRLQAQTNNLGTGLGTNWISLDSTRNANTQTVVLNGNPGCIFFRLIYP